jgi:twitching motility protein PilT
VAAFEVLFGSPAAAHLIRERKITQLATVIQQGGKAGMRALNDSLLDLVKRGVVSSDEALARTPERAALVTALREGEGA